MNTIKYHLIGFNTIFPLSTRGPGDMVPRSSTMASIYEAPLLPRLETLLGAITKIIISTRGRDIDLSRCENYSSPDHKWECIVSLVVGEYLGARRILGPILVLEEDNSGQKYYVNVGSRLLDTRQDCISKYVEAAKILWKSITEVDVKKKYSLSNTYKDKLHELEEDKDSGKDSSRCLLSPHSILATGIALENYSRATRHGLIYSYVLRDLMKLSRGRSYKIGLLVEKDDDKVIGEPIIGVLGPRGRPARLFEEPITSDNTTCLRKALKGENCVGEDARIAITPLPLGLVEPPRKIVHPLRHKPVIVQLAKSTLVEGKWAKTRIEPAYQPGVVVMGDVACRRLSCRSSSHSVLLQYTI